MTTQLKDVMTKYQPTIGIECHVQLATVSKLFAGADNDARDAEPNTTVSPLCFGFPGTLPVLNRDAVRLAIMAGLAMCADIPEVSRFERKHYFYPDSPLGYQITQLAEPVIVGGYVDAPQLDGTVKTVRIHHAHIEADAGKLTHPAGGSKSFVDLNRAGTPLIEIVSEADMHSPAEARAYAQELYKLMTFAGVTHGDLYQGNMRFDVNISLAPVGSNTLGTRAEIKNLNSFRAIEKAAEFEYQRQTELLEKGETIVQETRGWNEDTQKTFSQRSKEDAHDYRYFPDPDLPPVRVSQNQVEELKAQLPMMPNSYREAWAGLDLDSSVISSLLSDKKRAAAVYMVQQRAGDMAAKHVANWFASVVNEAVTHKDNEIIPVQNDLIELADMTEKNEISGSSAKVLFTLLLTGKTGSKRLAEAGGLLQVSDEGEIAKIVDAVLADPASAQAVADIKAGNDKAIGFLVGQVMKRSAGKANPGLAQKLIRQRL